MKKAVFAAVTIASVIVCIGLWGLRHYCQKHVSSNVSTNFKTPVVSSAIATGSASASTITRKMHSFSHLALSFEENRGQTDRNVKFFTHGAGYSVYLGSSEAVFVHRVSVPLPEFNPAASTISNMLGGSSAVSVVRLEWLGANSQAAVRGTGRQRGTSNYFIGNKRSKWLTRIPHYDQVQFDDLYPGVNLVYHGDQQHVEFDYDIAPGADTSAIQIGIATPSIVGLGDDGRLNISSGPDRVALMPPVAYQERDGRRQNVAVRYVLKDGHRVGLDVSPYDRSRRLLIDPVLEYAASFGTSNRSILSAITVDTQGNAYVTGTTCDTDYPVTENAFQTTGGSNVRTGCFSAVVSKLDPTGSSLLYSTYVGGTTDDTTGGRIVLDGAGELYVAGATAATDFPTTPGSYQPMPKGGSCDYGPNLNQKPCTDGILFKLSADGSNLIFSTYLGGERVDIITALALDSKNNIYVTGATNSTAFPMVGTPVQPTYGGGSCADDGAPCFDGFVAKFNPDASQLLASTYLGGSDNDYGTGIFVDSTGSNVYISGNTTSTNFPTTSGVVQPAHAGTTPQPDVFVTKLNGALSAFQYSTFIGGSSYDLAFALRVDSSGNAYVTGSTASPDFPHTAGSYQTTYAGPASAECPDGFDSSDLAQPTCGDVFIAKLNPSATALVFSTFLGGTGNDIAFNLALDSTNNIWVVGNSNSPNFPFTSDAYFAPTTTEFLFLSEIKNDGSQLLFSTGLSGGGGLALGIDIDSADDVFVAGQGGLSGTPGTYSFGQSGAVFVAKYSPGTNQPAVQLSSSALTFSKVVTNTGSAPQSVSLTNTGTGILHLAPISIVNAMFGQVPPPVFSETDNCGPSISSGGSCTINVIYLPTVPNATSGINDAGTLLILDDAPGAPHTISLNGSNGIVPSTSFLPPSLSFPGQQPGVSSAPQSSGLNGQSATANYLLATTTALPVLSGPNSSEFNVDESGCPVGSTGCEVTVIFTPAVGATGTRTATLTVPTNAPNSPHMLTLTGTVSTGPFAAVQPASPITLNPTTVGMTGTTLFFVQNTGGATLNVNGFTVSGANPSDFVITAGSCGVPFALAPQASCNLKLAFTPSAHGNRSASIAFIDNEATPATLIVAGYGADSGGPQITANLLSGSGTIFSDTTVGQSTSLFPAIVVLSNSGTGPNSSAHITAVIVSGDFKTQMDSTSPTCVPPYLLASNSSCNIDVIFAPTAVGQRNGTLTIQTDAPGTPSFSFNFTGNGILTAGVSLSPVNVQFGKQSIGGTTAAQTVALMNAGNGLLNLSGISISGPFSQTTTCGTTVAAGASCTFSIKFSPTVAGSGTGLLGFNGNSRTYAVGLNGTGVTGPVPQATPAGLTFGNQPIGTVSAPQAVAFSNVGDAAFTVSGVRASENFSVTSNCPSSIGPGVSCTINVSFAPTSDVRTGVSTGGSVFITTNAPNSPFAISATGTAAASTGAADTPTVTSSLNPSTVGQSVIFTGAVTSTHAGTPTGTVTFFDGATQLGSAAMLNAQAMATFTTSSLVQGNHSISCMYSGDAIFAPATSSAILQTVNAATTATTTTALVSSLNPSTVGQSVMFTATSTSTTVGTLTGTITLFDGATQLGTPIAISGGIAMFSTANLTQGTHSVTAKYSGDANFAGSTSPALTQAVNAGIKAPTTTALASSQNPSIAGASVTFTATVASSVAGTISGTVTFLDGATSLGTGAVGTGGIATFATSSLVSGSHTVTAEYGGDTNHAASTSPVVTQVVNAGADFSVSAIPNALTIVAGQSGSVTLTVTPENGSTQNVSFTCGNLPNASICSFAPMSTTLDGTHAAMTKVTIMTTARGVAVLPRSGARPPMRFRSLGIVCGCFAAIFFLSLFRTRNATLRITLAMLVLTVPIALLMSCAHEPSSAGGTPAGTSQVSITASSGSDFHAAQITLIVK